MFFHATRFSRWSVSTILPKQIWGTNPIWLAHMSSTGGMLSRCHRFHASGTKMSRWRMPQRVSDLPGVGGNVLGEFLFGFEGKLQILNYPGPLRVQKFLYVWAFWTVGTIGTLQARTERSWVKLNGQLLFPPKFTQGIKKKQYKGSKLLGVFPQTFCRIVSEQSSAHQKLHISLNSTGTVKSLSESFDPIGTKVASNWIVIDQIGAVLAKGTVQNILICVLLRVFAYFCGIFAHFLRGGFAPFFFWSWTVLDPTKHQTSPNGYVLGGQGWTDIAFLFQHLNH